MKNKSIFMQISIVILILAITKVLAISGSSDDYSVRLSLGNLASNASTDNYNEVRIFSDYLSANLTSSVIQGGRLSILKYNLPPYQPELNLPVNNTYTSSNDIEFSWFNTTDSNQEIDFDRITYSLEIYNDSASTQIYYINDSIAETVSQTLINLTIPEEITLYWRVLASDSELNSSYSDLRVFTIDTIAPSQFDLISPINATSTTDNSPSFLWSSSIDANLGNYTLELCTSEVYITPNYTAASTEISFSNWTTLVPADTYFWKVIATDKSNNQNTSLQQFTLTITPITQTITQTISTGEAISRSGGTVQKPFNIDIIAPPSVTVYSKDQVIVPLIITNPANELILKGINLNVSSDSEDISPTLAATFIPQLRPKEQRTVPLTIVTHTAPGAYGITVTADVIDPQFSDSVKIYANLIEKDTTSETRSSKQLIFARELFNGNPVCLELNEYLTQAELALKKLQYDKALNLAENAIQACKDLIAFKAEPEKTLETYIQKASISKNTLILIVESLAFMIILLIIFKLIRKKR